MPFARVERNILAGLSQLIYAMSFAAKEICVLRAGQGVFSQEAFRYGNTRCKPCFQSATPPPASLHATLVGPRSFVQYGHGLGKCATRLVSWAHRSDTPRVNRLPALRALVARNHPPAQHAHRTKAISLPASPRCAPSPARATDQSDGLFLFALLGSSPLPSHPPLRMPFYSPLPLHRRCHRRRNTSRQLLNQAGIGFGGETDADPVGAGTDVDAGGVRMLHGQSFHLGGFFLTKGFALGLGPSFAMVVGLAVGMRLSLLGVGRRGGGGFGFGRRCRQKLQVKGFKNFANAAVDLESCNVLIGGNGAGKSNFFTLLKLLRTLALGELQVFVEKAGRANDVLRRAIPSTRALEIGLDLPTTTGKSSYRMRAERTEDDRLLIRLQEIEEFNSNGQSRGAEGVPRLLPSHRITSRSNFRGTGTGLWH